MQDVIQKVIATEAEAVRIVAAARAEAERLLSAAQKQAAELLERARLEAREEAERLLETAVEAAEEEKRRQLALIRTATDSQLQLSEPARQRAVSAALKCIYGQCGLAGE